MEFNRQTNTPKVSVIMNCLNCEKYLREAIDSVYNQTYRDWEIIFWDNASTDKSAEIAKGCDSRLKYFCGETTVPLGNARNLALEKATGEFIAFLDCDDIWKQEKLMWQIAAFEQNPSAGLVFSNCVLFDNNGREILFYKKNKPAQGKIFRELLANYFISMETVMIRRTALLQLTEWFDWRFNLIEEAELFLRIAYKGWDFVYVDLPLAMWRMHNESWSFSRKHLFAGELQLMLEKFNVIFVDFEHEFRNEIERVKTNIDWHKALVEYESGNKKSAREKLQDHLFKSKKSVALYILTFFPYSLYKKIAAFFGFLN